MDRFWRSIRHTTCFRPRMCLLGVSFILLPILRVKSPKKPILGAWISIVKLNVQILKFAYYRNYCTDYHQILNSHKDHQVLFVGGPNTRKTNPRWRTAAILKNWKIAISQPRCDPFRQNLARRRSSTLLSVPTVKNMKFPKSKMAAAASWKIETRPYLQNGLTDLHEIWYDDAHWASDWASKRDRKLKFLTFENPRWRTAVILKIENRP